MVVTVAQSASFSQAWSSGATSWPLYAPPPVLLDLWVVGSHHDPEAHTRPELQVSLHGLSKRHCGVVLAMAPVGPCPVFHPACTYLRESAVIVASGTLIVQFC